MSDAALTLVAASEDADQSYTNAPAGQSVQPCGAANKEWVEIQLWQAGLPAGGAPFSLTLPDGRAVSGKLDARGAVRIEDVAKAGECSVSFPEVDAGLKDAPKARGDGVPYEPGRPAAAKTGAVLKLLLPDWDLGDLVLKQPALATPAQSAPAAAAKPEPDWQMDDVEIVYDD